MIRRRNASWCFGCSPDNCPGCGLGERIDPLKVAWAMISPFIVFAVLATFIEQPVMSGVIVLTLFVVTVVVFVIAMICLVASAAIDGWDEIFKGNFGRK